MKNDTLQDGDGRLASIRDDLRGIHFPATRPWVVGDFGIKASPTALQLIWTAIGAFPAERRTKATPVGSSDALFERPMVLDRINASLTHRADGRRMACRLATAQAATN